MQNPLSLVYFPAAVALGALHALEPGHAKALTASYLIGIKGTKRDSIVLGLSVALTHSIVVVGISSIGLWLGNEAFTGRATEWLEYGSGVLAIVIGSWMLWRRLALRHRIAAHDHGHHHHAPDPVLVNGKSLQGKLEIVDSPLGERMKFTATKNISENELVIEIARGGNSIEKLILIKSPDHDGIFLSTAAPQEPHEFSARLILKMEAEKEVFNFSITEPEGHGDHDHLDDVAHAKAHTDTLPDYVKKGEKPSIGQIALFGAAGGMIPCPASITVMLLALSTGRAAMGFVTVLGFSLGLAASLVGIGVLVVTGLSHISTSGRFSAVSKFAPVISACLVILSGFFALLIAHRG